MRRFFGRDDFSDLESELRNARPQPPAELLDELVSRVEVAPARAPARRPRLVAAFVFAVAVLIALAAFGGVGYAKSSVVSAAKSSSHVVTSVANRGHGDNNDKSTKNDNKQNNGNNGNNGNDGNNGNNGDDGNHQQGGDHHGDDDPPWMHQYTRYVLVCYPFTIHVGNHDITVHRTIVVPRLFVSYFVPPGTLGACRFGQG